MLDIPLDGTLVEPGLFGGQAADLAEKCVLAAPQVNDTKFNLKQSRSSGTGEDPGDGRVSTSQRHFQPIWLSSCLRCCLFPEVHSVAIRRLCYGHLPPLFVSWLTSVLDQASSWVAFALAVEVPGARVCLPLLFPHISSCLAPSCHLLGIRLRALLCHMWLVVNDAAASYNAPLRTADAAVKQLSKPLPPLKPKKAVVANSIWGV